MFYFFVLTGITVSIVFSFDLTILHAGDLNSEFQESLEKTGGFSRLLNYVKTKRKEAENDLAPPVVVFLTGNFFGSSIWYSIHRWRIVANFINLLKPDAIALGTKEFTDGLHELYLFISCLKTKVVGTNLKTVKHENLKRLIKESVVLDIKGKKVAVLGYTTRGYLSSKPVDFDNIIPALKRQCYKLKKRKDIDYVIALGHADFIIDQKVAFNSDCVDIVIGSNSEILMYNSDPPFHVEELRPYPFMVNLSDGSRVPVVHSYFDIKFLGELHVKFDRNNDIINASGNSIYLDERIKQDSEGLDLLRSYIKDLELKEKHVIGKTLTSLDGKSCHSSECTLGNLVTDSFCDYKASQDAGLFWTTSAIALINSGALRATQNITSDGRLVNEAFLYKSLPYQEQLVTVRISGMTLWNVLEHSINQFETSAFLQVSGLKIWYNGSTTTPEMEVLVRCAKCEVPIYEPLNETADYDIVTTKFLAEGGDDYHMFPNKKITYHVEVINSLQATMRYLEDYKTIIEQKEHRIVLEGLPRSSGNKRNITIEFLIVMIFIFGGTN